MLSAFEEYLTSVCNCTADQKYLLAVSGGIDSVVMAHLFYTSGLKFSIAHVNFQLRGEESAGDQQFVEDLAAKMQVNCYVKSFDTKIYAEQHGVSIQMAARDLRYNWFAALLEEHGIDIIAVGHNNNDVVETMFLNLSRGTGIRGLTGIRPRNENMIRPLLFATRQEILKYANDNMLQWREDSSNSQTKYHRNKIRHTIIPAFITINPAFMQSATDTIRRLEQTGQILDFVLQQVKKEVWTGSPDRILIDIKKLLEFPACDIILFELLRDFGISQISMPAVLNSFDSIPGKQFHTRTHCITRDRTHLIITKKSPPASPEIRIEQGTVLIEYPIHLLLSNKTASDFRIQAENRIAAIDADKISYPLLLRNWKAGDRFRPLGLSGSKKISDFLINNKISLPDKQYVWIIESDGEIVWVVNHRIDDRFKITRETSKILLLEYME